MTLALIGAISAILIFLWIFGISKSDPYIVKTLDLNGSTERGERIFRLTCVGCHGISAQGFVGPDLHEVTNRLNDPKIIDQVVKGLTPPMPSFEIDPQSMSDILKYMHSLN